MIKLLFWAMLAGFFLMAAPVIVVVFCLLYAITHTKELFR